MQYMKLKVDKYVHWRFHSHTGGQILPCLYRTGLYGVVLILDIVSLTRNKNMV